MKANGQQNNHTGLVTRYQHLYKIHCEGEGRDNVTLHNITLICGLFSRDVTQDTLGLNQIFSLSVISK
jgi:hypothetical protein